MSSKKNIARVRRAKRSRMQIKKQGIEKNIPRMSVHRTLNHIYVQILAPVGGNVLAQASSCDSELKKTIKADMSKKSVAELVGKAIAERAKAANIANVASDRSGFKYHGRVSALIEAARQNGLVV